jgi:acyl-CoA synthetase (AMP-forming)/AMP-acid ligase II
MRAGDGGGVGEICAQSPALADGYFNDPTRTAERFQSSRLNTRDLGFVHEGELYVTGRADDLMTIAGRNVYAHEIENAISIWTAFVRATAPWFMWQRLRRARFSAIGVAKSPQIRCRAQRRDSACP